MLGQNRSLNLHQLRAEEDGPVQTFWAFNDHIKYHKDKGSNMQIGWRFSLSQVK